MGLNLILTATRATEGQEGLEGEMHVTVHIIRAVKQETPPPPIPRQGGGLVMVAADPDRHQEG